MARFIPRPRLGAKLLLPTAAAVVAAGAVAIASIPSSNGVITACFNNQTGQAAYGTLRVIDPSAAPGAPSYTSSCQEAETQITWNQQGPAGPVGTPGAQGLQGLQGVQGPAAPTSDTLAFEATGSRMFLAMPGIMGESTDKDHKGDIQLERFAFGGAPAPGTTSRAHTSSLTITKKVDTASPKLFQAAATGKHFQNVQIVLARKAGGKEYDYLKISLQGVLISGVQTNNPSQGSPVEHVTLTFTKLGETFLGHGTSHINLVPSQVAAP
jgi:type VI secretion system secreted protein Hcp